MINVITPSASARNIHVVIEFLLIILTDVPKDVIRHDKLFVLLEYVGALNKEVSIIVHNLEKNIKETSSASLNLLENVELLRKDLKNVFLKAPADSSQLCFPRSDGPLFKTLLLRNLNDLLNSNAYSVALIKEKIIRMKENLEHIRSFFGNVEQELHRDLWTRVLNMAYEAEHAINSILAKDRGLLQLIFLFPEIVGKIKLVKKEVQEKISKNMSIIFVNSSNKPVINKSSIASKIIVGFEEETEWIIRKLTSGPAEVDELLWLTVYILKKRVSEDDIDDDIADKLRRKLFGKRYLIVLDDLWYTATWDELTNPFDLLLLRPEESWELLEKRIFREERCPNELKDVGEKIAQKCPGLPLVLDLIGGVISRMEKKEALWLKVLNNLSSFIFQDEEEVMNVIQLCYDYLSNHIKSCFLYLANYPKDKNIRPSQLKDLWSNEGLVEPTNLKIVEKVTEVYVDE
ncbi:putative late blight resistance protein R1-A-like isoform 2 [Capsicum annuum]|nr:putative late blight resistance protein R1-A-like isoform 2 [Capsicum annuum]